MKKLMTFLAVVLLLGGVFVGSAEAGHKTVQIYGHRAARGYNVPVSYTDESS